MKIAFPYPWRYQWRPISLLNVDYKIASKALAERLKKILPILNSHEQTAYVKDRFICETGRVISDIIEVSDVFNIDGFLVTMDIGKAFDSLNHSFLLAVHFHADTFWNYLLLNMTCLVGPNIKERTRQRQEALMSNHCLISHR